MNIFSTPLQVAITSIEAALTILQDNVMTIGRGFREYWFVSAACSFLQVRIATDEKAKVERERQAWDRVATLLYRVLASRKSSTVVNGAVSGTDLVVSNPIYRCLFSETYCVLVISRLQLSTALVMSARTKCRVRTA